MIPQPALERARMLTAITALFFEMEYRAASAPD
jgi:hypothetical protein